MEVEVPKRRAYSPHRKAGRLKAMTSCEPASTLRYSAPAFGRYVFTICGTRSRATYSRLAGMSSRSPNCLDTRIPRSHSRFTLTRFRNLVMERLTRSRN